MESDKEGEPPPDTNKKDTMDEGKTNTGKDEELPSSMNNTDKPKSEAERLILEKEEEIESLLDSKAKKLNMNRTQVRTLLRQVLGSKEVIDHSLQVAGDKEAPSASNNCFSASFSPSSKMEPRITRTIAKSVAEVGGKLDWVLETMKSFSQPSKSVNEDDTLVLVTQELPDDDKPEDDPEYNPETEMDVEVEDELEELCYTPNSSIVQTPPCSRNPALDSPSPSLNLEPSVSEEEAQSRLTRSKTSLKEVSIEELEKKFIPPDITSDMYSTEMDDYAMFLQETFGYQEPVTNNSPAVREEDPDFIYQDTEEMADHQYEFKFDRSTKIPRKEVDDLISELLAEYEDSKTQKKTIKVNVVTPNCSNVGEKSETSSAAAVSITPQPNILIGYPEISEEHISRLNQQMRQHIQLLLQMALLTSNDSQWSILLRECKTMFQEIVNRSLSQKFSLFAQDNLFPSLNLLEEWEESRKSPSAPDSKNKARLKISSELMEKVGESNCCIVYPYLLPSSYLKITNDKSYFSEGEDYLIVYGMDRFKGTHSKREMHRLISIHCMTPKTMDQIRWRIKNKSGKLNSNAIKAYVREGLVVSMNDPIIPYKSSQSRRLKHSNNTSGELPEVWCLGLNFNYDPIRASRHPLLVVSPQVPSMSRVIPIAMQGSLPTDESKSSTESRPDSNHVRLIVPKPVVTPQVVIPPVKQTTTVAQEILPKAQMIPEKPSSTIISKNASSTDNMNQDDLEIRQKSLPVFDIASSDDHSLQEAEAGDIFLCVQETLPPETRNLFFDKIVKLTSDKTKSNPAEIFTELHALCEGYSDLQERLLDLLNPSDALSLGPDIYFQFKIRNFAKKFLKKVSLVYKDDPGSLEDVLKELQEIVYKNPSQLNLAEVTRRAKSMFKSNESLCEEFLSFLPNVFLSGSALSSVESESDLISDKGPSEFEKAFLPKLTDIAQGSDRCICSCHTNEDGEKKVHCVHCSLRFVNGQVYRKDGKMTRSIQVRFKVAKDITGSSSSDGVPRKKRKNLLS